MKTITVQFNYEDTTIIAFAQWLGGQVTEVQPAINYIVERLVREPFLDHVNHFQQAIIAAQTKSTIDAAMVDAAAKLTIVAE